MVTAGISEIGTVTVPTGQPAGPVAGQAMGQSMGQSMGQATGQVTGQVAGQVTGKGIGQVMSQVKNKAGSAANNSAMANSENSVFAQLLNGLVGDEPQALPAIATGVTVNAARNQSVGAQADADTSQTLPSADLLALCGIVGNLPPTAPAAVTIDKAGTNEDAALGTAAADALPVALGIVSNAMANNAWMNAVPAMPQAPLENVAVSTTPSPAGLTANDTRSANASALTLTDMQWLNGDAHGDNNKAAAAVQINSAAATTTDAALEPLALPQDTAATSSEQQSSFQKLLTQATPMMAMLGAQLRDQQRDDSTFAAAQSDAQTNGIGSLSTTSLQPTGTQLASDAPAIEIMPRHQLHAPVGSQHWATELGNKLTMLASKDTQSATLYMTPADLGPVQVRIDMNQDQASVWFTAEHADTRSALEQSLPKLRELFSAQGMSLTDAGVFGDRSRQQQGDSAFTSTRFISSQYEDGETLADTATVRSLSLSLLDAYA